MSSRAAARVAATAICAAGLLGLVPTCSAAAKPPVLPVTGAALYAPQTGQMLYAEHPNRRRAIASTTKLMTALVTLRHVRRLSTVFAQNHWYPAADDAQLGLSPGDRMTVHDLLVAMMLPSDDDAAEDLAYNVGHRSVHRFVSMMNAQARRLGLRHTHYTTPIGLDTPGNYSTPADLAKLAEYDLTHSRFLARIVARKSAVVHVGRRRQRVYNRNDLVARYRWIDGVKTGHTSQAGYVLVASGHANGMSLISVVLGTASEQERDSATITLLDYGFGAFSPRTPVRAGQVLARPAVRDRPGVRVPVVAARGYTRVLPRSARVRVRLRVPRQLGGPLPDRAVVGTASILQGNRVLHRIPLVTTRRLSAVSGLTLTARFVTRPLTLLVIAAIVVGGLLWSGLRRQRRTRREGGEMEGP